MNDYIRLNVKLTPCSSDITDLLAAFLADAGYESFVATPDGLDAYISDKLYDENIVNEILQDFPFDVKSSFAAIFEEGKDWNEEWEKNYFKPIMIGNRCLIHSSFHKDLPEAEYDIVIDPKMAFGTGYHATTEMMITHLLNRNLEGKTITDMGTGTAILSILAMMHGAKEANGIEIDPAACINARENVALNNNSPRYEGRVKVTIHEGDASQLANLPKADIFLANINRNVILADIDRYVEAMKPESELILSGFYEQDIPLLEKSASLYSLRLKEKLVFPGGWSSIVLSRK